MFRTALTRAAIFAVLVLLVVLTVYAAKEFQSDKPSKSQEGSGQRMEGSEGEMKFDVTPAEATTLAQRAYVLAYPMMENYKTMYGHAVDEYSAQPPTPFNQFFNFTELIGPDFTEIVSPNNDTLYSKAFLDLRAEPIVLSVPPVPDQRYFSFQFVDMCTFNFAYVGARTTGFEGGRFLIAGPDFKEPKPKGISQVMRSDSQFIFLLGRTGVSSQADIPNALALQEQYHLTPLSTFLGESAPAAAPKLDFPVWNAEKAKSADFITYFNFLLQFVSMDPKAETFLDEFAGIGIGPGRPFDASNLDPAMRNAIEAGVTASHEKIEAKSKNLAKQENGWNLTAGIFGTREMMEGKDLLRAAAAMIGLYGNTLEEAYYPISMVDGSGEPLDASKHDYVLRFDKDRMPEVNAFWSLTMYGLPEKLLVANPANRYSIGSRTAKLEFGDDGSLTFYIQDKSPGGTQASNWLPAPSGPFYVVLRMYWPKTEAIGDPPYAPPPVEQADVMITRLKR